MGKKFITSGPGTGYTSHKNYADVFHNETFYAISSAGAIDEKRKSCQQNRKTVCLIPKKLHSPTLAFL